MSSILSGEQLVHLQAKTNYDLPLSGLKEFEPNKSWLEQKQIQSALDERKALLEEERVEKWNLLMEAEWIPERQKAEVKRKNKHWEVFGHHSDGKDWLFPEEVLYLMEMNCLECNFGDVALSIQKGYTLLLRPRGGCSITEYRVFSHLSRAGYRVVRHLPDLTVTAYERHIRLDQHLEQRKTYGATASAEQEIPRPDLPPKKIVDLSNNVEVFIEGSSAVPLSVAEEACLEKKEDSIISPEKQPVKPLIEVIDLVDSSSEESSDESSDHDVIEIIHDSVKYKVYDDDDDDVEIIEVPVPKKKIIVATIDSSDSEHEDDTNDSDSNHQSYDGNWKRSQPGQNKRPYVRPASMLKLNFLAVEEFCSGNNIKVEAKKSVEDFQNGNGDIDCETVEIGSERSDDSVEFISIEPRRARSPLPTLKSRNQILDMMPSMAKQKIMTVESPDLKFIPDSIRPKQKLYTYNTNSLRARVFSNFRPSYRGRRNFHGPVFNNYNPFYNSNNVFNANQLATRAPLIPNPTMTQLFGSDIHSVARGMMQFASALLSNGLLPQNSQPNGILPYSFQPNPLFNMPTQPSYGFRSQPLYDEPPRSFATPNHTRFSDSPTLTPVATNEHFRQPFQTGSFEGRRDVSRNLGSRDFDYSERTFTPPARRRHEHSINRPRRPRRPFGRNYLPRPRRSSPPRNFRGVDGDLPAIDPAYERPDVPVPPIECDLLAIDPAYMKPDVPAPEEQNSLGNEEENFIPIPRNNQTPIEVIDVLDNDDDFVPLKGVSNRFNRKRTKKMNKMKFTKKKQCLNKKMNESKTHTIIFLDSPTVSNSSSDVPVKQEVGSSSNVSVKTEASSSVETTVKQEVAETCSAVGIKQEKTGDVSIKIEGNVAVGQVKTEPNSGVRVKSEQSTVKDLEDVKPEVQTESSGSSSHLPQLVKTEQHISSEEVNVKTEPSSSTAAVSKEMEASHRATTDATPSSAAGVSALDTLAEAASKSITNQEFDRMELGHSSENELFENSEVTNHVTAEPNNIDLSKTTENMCSGDLVENADSSDMETEVIGNTFEIKFSETREVPQKADDSSGEVMSWAEMKKHNVPLGRSEESQDEEESSSEEEEGDKIRPLLRPRHCNTIGTVLSALRIFSPFTPQIPEDILKLKICFDMYLATDFRKAQRGLPQYRIVVFGGMDPIPSPAQLHELQARFKDSVPVLRAVVMPNSIVFYNCSSVSLPVDDRSYKGPLL